ncbi:alkene reductase [Breoghania sp.]|uniref:alkene reductase n=1 Tax=Breoghania sp. TaxID=2065378 RepID=UPI0029CA7A76|nr:alkene reductase [Breoghania sp.]
MTDKLFTPLKVGDVDVANRVAMAPLTRNRALPDGDVPHALNAEYYAQRAGAGLIISEGTQISPTAKGYAWTPGIYSDAQVAGWKLVTDAVHAKGGKIFAQIWHVGRVSHTSLQPGGQAPVAPSAITAETRTYDGKGFVATSQPRALEISEIAGILDDYRKAAANAERAGFDGVEIHAANGYLIDQFLRDGSNTRDDAYGGSIENRARFLEEVVDAVTGVLGGGRVGIRLSPFANANGITDSNPQPLFEHVVDRLNRFNLAYLHMVEGQTGGPRELKEGESIEALRKRFDGVYIANNNYTREMAIEAVESGKADMVAFGRPFIANPDLVERLAKDAPLNEVDRDTLYGGGEAGYTDYPFLEEVKA